MRLYSFYTPSHHELKDDWFLRTIGNDVDVTMEKFEQECRTGEFMSDGWSFVMRRKAELILRAIRENPGKIWIYADADIQFFRPMADDLRSIMESGQDFAIQRENPRGRVCPGFVAGIGNERNLRLWEEICRRIEKGAKDDQEPLNNLLGMGGARFGWMLQNLRKFFPGQWADLRWTYLPPRYFTPGFAGKLWNPGDPLDIPRDIILHHANWTLGVHNKIAQLKYVRSVVDGF